MDQALERLEKPCRKVGEGNFARVQGIYIINTPSGQSPEGLGAQLAGNLLHCGKALFLTDFPWQGAGNRPLPLPGEESACFGCWI